MNESGLEWNWNRSIHVNREITDDYVAKLIPEVLQLKQESDQPITVGIDSVGGSTQAAQQLMKVLQTPDRDGKTCKIVTVAVNKAFSAAASLLTTGDYAVAMPSAQILYHDVRFGEVLDVTPTKAAQTARDLSRENDRIALTLAQSVARRMAWLFIGLSESFKESTAKFPKLGDKINSLAVMAQ